MALEDAWSILKNAPAPAWTSVPDQTRTSPLEPNIVPTNPALSAMQQDAHTDFSQGLLDEAQADAAQTEPTRLQRLIGRENPRQSMVDWRKKQLDAAKEGKEVGSYFSAYDNAEQAKAAAGDNRQEGKYVRHEYEKPLPQTHHVQRMPAPDVGAESSFQTNPQTGQSAFEPLPAWMGPVQPQQPVQQPQPQQ